MAKEKCPPTTEQLSFNNIVNSKRIEARAAYYKIFSNDYGLSLSQVDALKESMNSLKLKIRQLQRKSKGFLDRKTKKDIKILERQIATIKLKIDEAKPKKPIIKRIEKLLMNHVMHVQESQLFGEHANPETIFKVLKETMSIPRGIIFDKFTELDNNTLISIERQISRELFRW